MPGTFKLKDKHIAFCNGIVTGMTGRNAYLQFLAVNPNCSKISASISATRLLARPEIQQCLQRLRLQLEEKITGEVSRLIPKEFSTPLLTVDEMDNFHSAIVQGIIEVEEVVPVYRWTEVFNKAGKVIQRNKEANFVRVKRPANVREKQISIDALYKRFGNYAPSKIFGAFGRVNEEGEVENVERVIMLSTGEKVPLL